MLLALFLLFLNVYVKAVTFTHEFVRNDLVSECRFNLGGDTYILCPLLRPEGLEAMQGMNLEYEWSREASMDRVYRFVFSGMAHGRECPEGTWVCMTRTSSFDHTRGSIESYQTTHIPIAGKSRPGSPLVDQGINAIASVLSRDDYPATPHLNLFLIGGFIEGRAQYVNIEFICDSGTELGTPLFMEEKHGVHMFTWITKHSCPTPSTADSEVGILDYEEDSEPSSNPDANPEDSGDDKKQELLDPKPYKPSRKWMAAVLLATGTIFITLSIFFTFPHARLVAAAHLKSILTMGLGLIKHHSIPYLPRSLQFRVGERRLVQWAQEDMSLGLISRDQNEDLDNTSLGIDDWNGEELGSEYIPLRLTTRKNYGSAVPGGKLR